MAILGDNTTPSSGNWTDSFGNSQFWIHNQFTMPSSGGIASDMNIYFAGFGGNATIDFMLWDSGGNIYWRSNGTTYSSTETWKQTTDIAGLWIPAGTYSLGFWTTNNVQWQVLPNGRNGGTLSRHSVGSPTTATGGGDEYGGQGFGSFAAYITYTAGGGVRDMRNGSFGNAAQVSGQRSGSMGSGPASVMRNGSWVRSV